MVKPSRIGRIMKILSVVGLKSHLNLMNTLCKDERMSNSIPLFIINHVFMPPKLPQQDDVSAENEEALCQNIYETAQEFIDALPEDERSQWTVILRLLEQFVTSHRSLLLSQDDISCSLRTAESGDVRAFLIRAQNAGVIIRKESKLAVFESFEVSSPNKDVMAAKGRLLRSFPDPAVQIPIHVFEDHNFQTELARFLAAMDNDTLDSSPITVKSKTAVTEVRDTAHPRYITQLLTEILRAMGDIAEVPRITKRIADDILWSDAYMPWRRSAVWLVLRVALQTTLVRERDGRRKYKEFMVFLHARILKLSLDLNLPSYLIACMQKKTARRLNKLSSTITPFILHFTRDTITEAESLLQKRWKTAQVAHATSINSDWAPVSLDIPSDTALSLKNSRDYIRRSLTIGPIAPSAKPFNPNHSPRLIGVPNFTNSSNGKLATAFSSQDSLTSLADFERAVLIDLTAWASQNLLSSDACHTIATCIETYSNAASKAYSSNPELLSTMMLTLFKLWVELDRMAVAQCPLLSQLSPEIPLHLLHSLLIRTSESIRALDYVEYYLKNRHSRSIPGQSVFISSGGNTSFAGQYFNTSGSLQALKARIEEAARLQRARKVEELRQLKARYQSLMSSAQLHQHQYVNKVNKKGKMVQSNAPNCPRCKLEKQATGLVIQIHEWPLPQDPSEAKFVVFELAPPLPFVIWRKITYMFLRDVCIPDSSSAFLKHPVHMHLQKYPALQPYYAKSSINARIVLASSTKSFNKSHYKAQKVAAATESSVCVTHGLKWSLLDNSESEWVTQQVIKCSIDDYCTIRLPPGRYQSLQYAVSGTSHTSNNIMANQTECPSELTLHEFIAFARIRSGPRLQWLNIISELRSGYLSFQDEAVCLLLKQATWQVGPLTSDHQREWHIEPTEKTFGKVLLTELRDLFLKMKANRRNVIGMQVITVLVSRLLASAADSDVVAGGFRLMREVRSVTYGWLNKILSTIGDIEDQDRLRECQIHICEVALTCRGTYDVDLVKVPHLLSETEDIAIFIHCAILAAYYSPSSVSNVDAYLRGLLNRDRRLAHMTEKILLQRIAHSRKGLDESIARIWKLYRPSRPWTQLPLPNDRWISTFSTSHDIQYPQTVHLDLLSGQLLIDGKPLGRLPQNIVTHPTYKRIFGQKYMDVIPADMPGMDYKTSTPIGSDPDDGSPGYQVFFSLRQSNSQKDPGQLVIRTQRDTEILELIPHEIFQSDLPTPLVKGQTHWLNVSTFKGEIEIRDLNSWWKSSPVNWRIIFSSYHSSTCVRPDGESNVVKLVDSRSTTMSMISSILRSLEIPEYLIVSYSSSGQLAVSLPRFRLDFFLNDQPQPQLESLNVPGMIVDTNQSSQTMIGFRSQLVLRSKDSLKCCQRLVIIPYARDSHFHISPLHHHTDIILSFGDQPTIRYFRYTINSALGRLDGDGTLISKLYQVYLHGITSHCLPDPLTGRTGAEEALQQLGSAGVMSFQKLGNDERQMLQHISALTPVRKFYPLHLNVMQTVVWSKHVICPLAQHSDFRSLTQSIWQYAETLRELAHSKDKLLQIDFNNTVDHLILRAACHNAKYYREPMKNGALLQGDHDIVYHSRGRSIYTTGADEGLVFKTSAMVFNWESRLPTHNQLHNALKQHGSVSGNLAPISLMYSREWIECKPADLFFSACNACREAEKESNRYQMVFSLSACAYASNDNSQLIPTVFAFAVIPELRNLSPPYLQTYDLSMGLQPSEGKLSEMVLKHKTQPPGSKKSKKKKQQKQLKTFQDNQVKESRELVGILMGQWPCPVPVIPKIRQWLFTIPRVENGAAALFQNCLRNQELLSYIQDVQRILDKIRWSAPTHAIGLYRLPPSAILQHPKSFDHVSFQQLIAVRSAPDIPPPPTLAQETFQLSSESKDDTVLLREVLTTFRKSTYLSQRDATPATIQAQYADHLETSLRSLEVEVKDGGSHRLMQHHASIGDNCRTYQRQCEAHLEASYELVRKSLLPSTQAEHVLLTAGLWPCLTPMSLFSLLSFDAGVVLSKRWRKSLNGLAKALIALQHSSRLTKHLQEKRLEELSQELQSTVVEAEDDEDEQCSVQLLIQLDCDFLARKIQIDFAREMVTPSSQGNTVLQLNMGEGKSSVIVPLAAAMLSDGERIVRVVVLRPLAPSMFQILAHRLGGLANRRVFYLPFSRTPRFTLNQAREVQQLFLNCIKARGVLVVQPDHILSFRLMGLDRTSSTMASIRSTDPLVANQLLETQKWLSSHSRDILDESDEILHVKYQLIYTVGQQQSLHGSPDRWTIAQQILALVKKHSRDIHPSYPDGLEVMDDRSGGYPRIRVLRDDAGAALVALVADDILNGALDHCSFELFPVELRSSLLQYITSSESASQDLRLVEDSCKRTDMWNTLLIIRGLLGYGILHFVLKEKRWRVDYGPDFSRSMMAVPYSAKDVPSLRAEFSHPDVAILLTCLSYYWQGLSQNQLEQCFTLLFKQDNPSLEYSKWIIHSQTIPEQLRHLGGINLRDLDQRMELYDVFYKNEAVINFFLSQVVFPRDAKEFPRKMATSGWDLAERKAHVTTGFSGTNDGRYLLPTSIDQADPLSQSSTNAKVLMYLLRPENNYYRCIAQNGQHTEQSLLHLLVKQKPEIRVLLDVGAQILRLSNEEVAAEWLKLNTNPHVFAVVFFGSDDEPYVRTRNGVIEGFVSSPFRHQLDTCLLYLDDAHTRGTDFKLPSGTRAAVTLGPKVTKDRLVQGCMRMRRLGFGHTIIFFAPPEVDHGIRIAAGLGQENLIGTKDIVLWTMFESCLEVLNRLPQWAQQGIDHRKREIAWREFTRSSSFSIDRLEATWLQNEARPLNEMYALDHDSSMSGLSHQLRAYPDLLARYLKWTPSTSTDTRFHEEQEREREVLFEVETERHVKRPSKAAPATHNLHADVRNLVKKGIYRRSSPAFVSLFTQLAGVYFEGQSWSSSQLLCTQDFSVTVQSSRFGNSCDYLRPVNWILSCVDADTGRFFVVLSPYEVNELLPDIRQSRQVHLHQYSPRITQEMKSFEDLAFHCVPPLSSTWTRPDLEVTTRLNLWAGQLYLEDEKAYLYLCDFLGLYSWQPRQWDKIQPDGFIEPSHRYGSPVANSPFQTSPVSYLKQLFAARRKGMDYTPTHIGKILRARLLTGEDFHLNIAGLA